MPSMTEHQSGKFTKMLLMGDSGAGKTGSLVSLVQAGYKLRILDMDNGLDSLALQIKHRCKDKLGNVEYRTIRDKIKASASGPILDGPPKAFPTALQMLDNWKYDTTDLGKPATWGPEAILVIDTLTYLSKAAYQWTLMMQASSSNKDGRMMYFHAQQAIENVLALIQSESFATNVIVISHISWVERGGDGMTKGYPSSVGSALAPTIPQYFNSVALATTSGSGANVKRTIQTASTALIDLKNPAPFAMAPSLPLETAMATFFETVRK